MKLRVNINNSSKNSLLCSFFFFLFLFNAKKCISLTHLSRKSLSCAKILTSSCFFFVSTSNFSSRAWHIVLLVKLKTILCDKNFALMLLEKVRPNYHFYKSASLSLSFHEIIQRNHFGQRKKKQVYPFMAGNQYHTTKVNTNKKKNEEISISMST